MPLSEATIGAIGAVAGAGVSAAGQSSLNRATRKFNAEQAELQRQWSEAMFNKQNAWNYERWLEENKYNSPLEQVNRLRDAGLNPLYFGLDGSSAGDISSAQPLGYERANMSNMVNPLSSFEDSALKVAQIANIQANTAKTGEETLTEVQKREKIMAEIDNVKQEYNNLLENEALTKVERSRAEKDLEWLDRINEATVGAREAEAKLTSANEKRILSLLPGEKELQKMSIEDFERRWEKISAEIDKISADTGLTNKDIENYALNHMSNGIMGSGFSITNIRRDLHELQKTVRSRINEGGSR